MAKGEKENQESWLRFLVKHGLHAVPYAGSALSSAFSALTKPPKPGEEPTKLQRLAGYKKEHKLERVPLTQEEQALKSLAMQQLQQYLPLALQQLQQPSQLEQAVMPGLVGQAIPQLLQFGMNNPVQGPGAYDPYGLGSTGPSLGGGLQQIFGGLMPLLQMYQASQGGQQAGASSMQEQGQSPQMMSDQPLNIPPGYGPGGVLLSPEGQKVQNYVNKFREVKRK
ncbi:MAG: hypothetical protein R3230_01470 [Nitrosopumilaceae archaeon]|nr:hypothetical protein [Nitrosopumilaceae archaeon]